MDNMNDDRFDNVVAGIVNKIKHGNMKLVALYKEISVPQEELAIEIVRSQLEELRQEIQRKNVNIQQKENKIRNLEEQIELLQERLSKKRWWFSGLFRSSWYNNGSQFARRCKELREQIRDVLAKYRITRSRVYLKQMQNLADKYQGTLKKWAVFVGLPASVAAGVPLVRAIKRWRQSKANANAVPSISKQRKKSKPKFDIQSVLLPQSAVPSYANSLFLSPASKQLVPANYWRVKTPAPRPVMVTPAPVVQPVSTIRPAGSALHWALPPARNSGYLTKLGATIALLAAGKGAKKLYNKYISKPRRQPLRMNLKNNNNKNNKNYNPNNNSNVSDNNNNNNNNSGSNSNANELANLFQNQRRISRARRRR